MPPRGGAGGTILFHSDRTGFEEIFVMDADGSNVRQLTHVGRSESASVDAEGSPDRQWIAFSWNRTGPWDDFYVMDADGGKVRQLTDTPEVSEHAAAWSPDGRQIVYTAKFRSPTAADGTRQDREPPHIWIMDADGSNARALTSGSSRNMGPAWSPDGSMIAFVSDRHAEFDINLIGTDNGDLDIYVMDRYGSNVRRLTDGGDPAWSPDGQQIAFSASPEGNAEGMPQIHVMNADGSNRRRLTDGRRVDVRPAWSPDGEEIVFNCGFYQHEKFVWVRGERRIVASWEICLIRADGSDFRTLTKNEVVDAHPDWW
jgi:TolB protein